MVTDSARSQRCEQCGNSVQEDDEFCGVCGAKVPSSAPTTELPRQSSFQGALVSIRDSEVWWAVAISVLLVLLVSIGVLAYAASKPNVNIGSSPTESPEGQGGTTAEKEDTQESTPPSSNASAAPKENGNPEEKLRAAVQAYYEAVDRENWGYTYDNLDSQTKEKYTRDEYVQKNQYLAGADPLVQSSPVVTSEVSTSSPVEVTLNQTFTSGATRSRITYFVWENGAWKHRFSQQDDAIFLPNASYSEFVAAKKSGS